MLVQGVGLQQLMDFRKLRKVVIHLARNPDQLKAGKRVEKCLLRPIECPEVYYAPYRVSKSVLHALSMRDSPFLRPSSAISSNLGATALKRNHQKNEKERLEKARKEKPQNPAMFGSNPAIMQNKARSWRFNYNTA